MNSRDPLEVLHSDLFDLIFQHLPWGNLLASSAVNSLWYEAIGTSSSCMNKLKLNIQNRSREGEHISLEVLNAHSSLRVDKRHYRNIYADFSHLNREEVLQILEPNERKWKSVQLLNENFVDGTFLYYFCQGVECLELARISVNCDQTAREKLVWDFPRLTRLKIFSCNGTLVKHLENCSKLKEFVISESSSNGENSYSESCVNILLNNNGLTTLMIFSPVYQTFFPRNIYARIQFKLKKLVIDSFKTDSKEDDRECMRNLLINQSGSLEAVDINLWCGSEILEICFRMPRLKDFSCNVKEREENLEWNRINLTMSESILRFHIRNVCRRESLNFFDVVFTNLPNLKVYKSKFMHFEDLISLSHRCKSLEELFIENFNVSWLPSENCFPMLRRFKSWDVNDDLIDSLTAKGAKNHFEELLLVQ